jgi:hypothetical protein
MYDAVTLKICGTSANLVRDRRVKPKTEQKGKPVCKREPILGNVGYKLQVKFSRMCKLYTFWMLSFFPSPIHSFSF